MASKESESDRLRKIIVVVAGQEQETVVIDERARWEKIDQPKAKSDSDDGRVRQDI